MSDFVEVTEGKGKKVDTVLTEDGKHRQVVVVGGGSVEITNPTADPETGLAKEDKQDEAISILRSLDGKIYENRVYVTNAIDEASGTLTYIGKEDNNGAWQIQKIDTSSGTVFTYATVKNNPMVTSYTDAWSNRGTLTYGRYGEVL